jgi:invasion protein IalB
MTKLAPTLCALLSALTLGAAQAQQPAAPRQATPRAAAPPAAAQAPASPATAANEALLAEERPWAVTCTAPQNGQRDCQMTATVVLRQNNERLARIILRRQPETRSLTMVFQLPHGAWLPGGVQWQVDEGEAQRLPFNTSDADGLYAGIAVTDDVLGALRRGTSLRLAVVAAAQRQVLNIPVPLARMNEAFGEFVAQERAR